MTCPIPDLAKKLKDTPVGDKLLAMMSDQKELNRINTKIDFKELLGIEATPVGRPNYDRLLGRSEVPTDTYAGIGSRETPAEIQAQMNEVAKELEAAGYTLRSGNAEGADKAFEGVNQNPGKDYSKLITQLKDKVKSYTKFITDKPIGINVHRKLEDGKFGIYGNPFSQWTVGTNKDDVLSAMFYDWIVHNRIPATYVPSGRGEVWMLDKQRKALIN